MTVTLVLPAGIADELFAAPEADVETACVLLARPVETPAGNVRLLARALHWCRMTPTWSGLLRH